MLNDLIQMMVGTSRFLCMLSTDRITAVLTSGLIDDFEKVIKTKSSHSLFD